MDAVIVNLAKYVDALDKSLTDLASMDPSIRTEAILDAAGLLGAAKAVLASV